MCRSQTVSGFSMRFCKPSTDALTLSRNDSDGFSVILLCAALCRRWLPWRRWTAQANIRSRCPGSSCSIAKPRSFWRIGKPTAAARNVLCPTRDRWVSAMVPSHLDLSSILSLHTGSVQAVHCILNQLKQISFAKFYQACMKYSHTIQ